MLDLSQYDGFDWDQGNLMKNWDKHRVSPGECEQIFFHQPLIILFYSEHSEFEEPLYVMGKTDRCRRLFLVCTTRGSRIRVISARDMTKAEKTRYET